MQQQTRKVVINSEYGGFGLSPKAIRRLAELQGKPCYFFVRDPEQPGIKYKPATLEEVEAAFMWTAYIVPNPYEVVGKYDDDLWMAMPLEERQAINARWRDITLSDWSQQRDDPMLVQVVEELGESASGRLSELRVVEIPVNADYEIQEYDGREWIAEKHRTWA